MKTKITLLIVLAINLNSNAQFFKKLKSKITKKIDQAVDGNIDQFFKKKTKEVETTQPWTSSYSDITSIGSININHNNSIGKTQITSIDQLNVTASNETLNINGSWLTHDVDIADGVFITIKDKNIKKDNLAYFTNKTYKLYKTEDEISSTGAIISLAFDPNKTKGTPSKDYQNYYITQGSITISNLTKNSIAIKFSGTPFDRYKTIKNLASHVNGNLNASDIVHRNDFYGNDTTVNDSSDSYEPEYTKEDYKKDHKTINKIYSFDTEVTMISKEENGNQHTFSFLQNKNESYIGISIPNSGGSAIMVQDDNTSITLIQANGQKMQIPNQNIGMDAQLKERFATTTKNGQFKKTGKTKKILNYIAHQYISKDDVGHFEFWTSEAIKLENKFIGKNPMIKGYVLEMIYTTKGKTFTSKVTDIKHTKSKYNTSEYKNMMNMSF